MLRRLKQQCYYARAGPLFKHGAVLNAERCKYTCELSGASLSELQFAADRVHRCARLAYTAV